MTFKKKNTEYNSF